MGGGWIDREAEKSQLVLLMTIRIVNNRGVAIIFFLRGCNTGAAGSQGNPRAALRWR